MATSFPKLTSFKIAENRVFASPKDTTFMIIL
jgi:hypothetical protein